jgi:hypothetical protein
MALGELERLRAQEERLRQKRILLLRRELARMREAVEALERELRRLGDRQTALSAGRIAWAAVYKRLGETFTTKKLRELTGVAPSLAASVAFAWKKQGWIVTTERGRYRKTALRRRRRSRARLARDVDAHPLDRPRRDRRVQLMSRIAHGPLPVVAAGR